MCGDLDIENVAGAKTRTRSELNGNKVQFVRIRYKNGKFCSNSVSILNVTLAAIVYNSVLIAHPLQPHILYLILLNCP